MANLNKTLVCRRCNRHPELVREEGASDIARCSVCGVFGNYEEIRERAVEYEARSEINRINHGRQKRLIDSTRGSKNVTYRTGKLPVLSAPDFIFR